VPVQADRDWSAALLDLYGEARQREGKGAHAPKPDASKGPCLRCRSKDTPAATLTLRGEVLVEAGDGLLKIRYGTGYSGTLEHWQFNTFPCLVVRRPAGEHAGALHPRRHQRSAGKRWNCWGDDSPDKARGDGSDVHTMMPLRTAYRTTSAVL
jgi:hypothetical protein